MTGAEIEQAIINQLRNQGVSTKGKHIDVIIKGGRKGNGATAMVTILEEYEVPKTSSTLKEILETQDEEEDSDKVFFDDDELDIRDSQQTDIL